MAGYNLASAIGLDSTKAMHACSAIEKEYASIMNYMVKDMQKNVIDVIGKTWIGKDAQSFVGNTFIKTVKECTADIERVFESIISTINQNASNYDLRHDTQVYRNVSHSAIQNTLNAQSILGSINGFVGIADTNNIQTIANGISQIATNVGNSLLVCKNAASDSGFVGGEQQNSLNESISKIKSNLEKLAEELKKQTTQKINDIKAEEEALAAQASRSFGTN